MVWNASTTPPGPALGQTALNSGHRKALLSMSPDEVNQLPEDDADSEQGRGPKPDR